MLASITELIAQDGVDTQTAIELAGKILEYERNLAYQIELFVQDPTMGLSFQAPLAADEQVGVRGLFGAEVDMFDDYLDWEKFNKRPIPDKDLKFILNSKLKTQKLWLRMDKRRQRDKFKRAVNSLRYLKRSSSQLIKALKALSSS